MKEDGLIARPTVQFAVLEAIQGMLHNGKQIFSEEEEERIASIVDIMIEKDRFPQQEIVEWISGGGNVSQKNAHTKIHF